ncbi:MAG: aspartate-semialdehyde dehydrogenase [Bacillota bacterium]|nr:aspartate-semialdehyde dehydrogenase [Bacillota bacterium]
MKKYRVGIIGATGMVGQRLITLLENHPWFEITALSASARSAGQNYEKATEGRWQMKTPLPEKIKKMPVFDSENIEAVSGLADFVFCAVSLSKAETLALEERYAKSEIPVVSCNSACRMVPDVPMLIPEINPEHAQLIHKQRERLGTQKGFIAVKPNCSIQSYVPVLHALMDYEPTAISVCTYQALSGAGKTLETWPEMQDNVNPYIAGEDEKSEQEPMKVWGKLNKEMDGVIHAELPVISAQCLRVPVSDGHMAAVSVKFRRKPEKQQILDRLAEFKTLPQELGLPSAPDPFIVYMEEDNRPQTALDRDRGNGMAITMGRLREDPLLDWKFVCLSHNTLRGAAGGAVLMAEMLCKQGYIEKK